MRSVMKNSFMQHMARIPLLVGLAAALLATSATAATVSYSSTQSVGSAYADFALGKFNTGLGTLTAVEIKVDFSTLAGSFIVTSQSASTVTVTAVDAAFRVRQSPANTLGYAQTNDTIFDVVTSPDWNVTTVPGNSSQVYTIVGGQSYAISPQNIAAGNFAAYQSAGGVGSVIMQGRVTPTIAVSGGTYSVDPTAVGASTKMTVTYTYTAVPEPAAWILAAFGLTTAVVFRRRRRVW